MIACTLIGSATKHVSIEAADILACKLYANRIIFKLFPLYNEHLPINFTQVAISDSLKNSRQRDYFALRANMVQVNVRYRQ